MRRFFVAITLIFVSVFCFAQQNLPSKITGRIPSADSQSLYQIQVGAFLLARNVVNMSNLLRDGGFDPVLENYGELTRVIIPGIPAHEIIANLQRLKRLGIDQVIIREDANGFIISEKWNIPGDESRFSSFEFNQDNRFIVVERQEGYLNPTVHFGEYVMPRPNIINMNNFGTLRIMARDGDDIDFSFAPVGEPYAQTAFSAVREEPMPRTPETDLFARAWRVIDSNKEETTGTIFLFSINGTYLVSKPDGTSFTSHWRWQDGKRDKIEYSHNNWWSYGRADIDTLTQRDLIFFDPGFNPSVQGFSFAGQDWFYELVPITGF